MKLLRSFPEQYHFPVPVRTATFTEGFSAAAFNVSPIAVYICRKEDLVSVKLLKKLMVESIKQVLSKIQIINHTVSNHDINKIQEVSLPPK